MCAHEPASLFLLITRVLGNVGDDCPVFDGLFEFCSISAGGSMGTSSRSTIISPYG